MPKTTIEDFTGLVRRAGLTLTAAQVKEIHNAWGYVEEMLERVRTPLLPRDAEPATIFKPENS
jgi:hypothetical protein